MTFFSSVSASCIINYYILRVVTEIFMRVLAILLARSSGPRDCRH